MELSDGAGLGAADEAGLPVLRGVWRAFGVLPTFHGSWRGIAENQYLFAQGVSGLVYPCLLKSHITSITARIAAFSRVNKTAYDGETVLL